MLLGVRACNGTSANDALKNVHTMNGSGTTLFNEYNQENFFGSLSTETTKAKVLFGAIIQFAQKNHMSVAEAAKYMKGQLAQGLQNNSGIVNKIQNRSHITSVLTTQDENGEDIVYVGFKYAETVNGKVVYHSSQIIIPANAADMQRPHKEKNQTVAERPAPKRSAAEQEAMAKAAVGYRP